MFDILNFIVVVISFFASFYNYLPKSLLVILFIIGVCAIGGCCRAFDFYFSIKKPSKTKSDFISKLATESNLREQDEAELCKQFDKSTIRCLSNRARLLLQRMLNDLDLTRSEEVCLVRYLKEGDDGRLTIWFGYFGVSFLLAVILMLWPAIPSFLSMLHFAVTHHFGLHGWVKQKIVPSIIDIVIPIFGYVYALFLMTRASSLCSINKKHGVKKYLKKVNGENRNIKSPSTLCVLRRIAWCGLTLCVVVFMLFLGGCASTAQSNSTKIPSSLEGNGY